MAVARFSHQLRSRKENPVVSWFALQARTRTESRIQTLLRDKGYETFLPTYIDCRTYSDRIRKVQASVFPGYLFCQFDPRNRLNLLITPGILNIVSFGGGPAPIEASEIEALRCVLDCGADLRPWPGLVAGDRVRVEHGAFAGAEGTLVRTRGSDYLVLSITILQRSACVKVDRTWVRPLDEARMIRPRCPVTIANPTECEPRQMPAFASADTPATFQCTIRSAETRK